MKSNDYVVVNQENERVMFKNMDFYYKRGIPYYGEVSAWKDTFRSKLPEVQHDGPCVALGQQWVSLDSVLTTSHDNAA